ncbi:hypothetical protein FRC02_001965 [Tulasnella sp. 418]|nr:hypothetical protein FRC02_001965 [Tulasnella sp. 418]
MSSQTLRIIEWSARVRCKVYALGSSYSVLVFIGPIPENKEDWRRSPSFVGMHAVYAGSREYERGSNDNADEEDIVSEGYVHLNTALIESGIRSLLPEDVVPCLTSELGWRVQKVSGEVISLAQTSFLEIVVTSMIFECDADGGSRKPIGPPVDHHQCTTGRLGGYSGHARR